MAGCEPSPVTPQRGKEVLEVARLSLSVLAQVVRCSDSGLSPIVLMSEGKPLTSAAATTSARLMCGGMYEAYWESRPSLSVFVGDAELIQEFLQVEAEFAKAAR